MSAHTGHLSDLLAPRIERREVALWSSAALLVVSLHVGSGWLLHQQSQSEPKGAEEAPAVMLDLAPMLAAPQAVPLDIPELLDSNFAEEVDEPLEKVESEPTETVAERVVEADEVEPVEETEVAEPTPDLAEAVEPEEVAETKPEEIEPEEVVVQDTEEVIPDLVEARLPEVAMLVPEPKPILEEVKPAEKPVVKKKPEPKKKVAARPKPKQEDAPQLAKSAQNAKKEAAPKGAKGSGASDVNAWKAKAVARIRRAGRDAKENGIVTVRFTVSASGSVGSVSVIGSSGNGSLDSEAVRMVRRASPFPSPPASLGPVTVPVRFARR